MDQIALEAYAVMAAQYLHAAEAETQAIQKRVRAQGTTRARDIEELCEVIGRVSLIAANSTLMLTEAIRDLKSDKDPGTTPDMC